MTNVLNTARLIAHTLLDHEKSKGEINEDVIWRVINKVEASNIIDSYKFNKNELFDILINDLSISRGNITALSDEVLPWLNSEKSNIRFELWNRYKLFMKQKDPSFPIDDLDDFTDTILDKCVNPKHEGSWDRRGMVVGHVQSGKTSNYVGLINKATDAGYKLIIVIAGTISSLRRQTQKRIDEGYIGRSSQAFNQYRENRPIGVGRFSVDTEIYSFTSSYYLSADEGDFSIDVARRLNIPIGKNPVIFVIKKNKDILENLIDWLSKDQNVKITDGQPKLYNVPTLIIDDEADTASLNTSKSIAYLTTINNLIRTLINLFDKKTFIGYTATPYANLFIPQEFNAQLTSKIKGKDYLIGQDLFPKDFIINIKAPSNYIGAAKVFGLENPITGESNEPLNIFREINDFDPPFFSTLNSKNKNILPEYLPNSLEYAIKSFILVCTIRRIRGQQNKHNSMLVHVALYVSWIDRIAALVNEKIRIYKNYIQGGDISFINDLKEIFINDFHPSTQDIKSNLDYEDSRIFEVDWASIQKELINAVLKIEVRAVHGIRSISNLEYKNISEIDYDLFDENGISVIAVGGSRLARGITLEGLSISYYLRTSKMYDTLMQMGRWFGYRPGYVDLCRIFTTSQIFEWFNHITLATEEMRNDFDELAATLKKPKDFSLKVRNHSGLLTITSVAKLYFSKNIELSFSGKNPQTYKLSKNIEEIKSNKAELNSLITKIGEIGDENIIKHGDRINYLLFKDQNSNIISDFIEAFKVDQPNINNRILSDYIHKQNEKRNIKSWSICIVLNTDRIVKIASADSNSDQKTTLEPQTVELNFINKNIRGYCKVRNQPKEGVNNSFYFISKNQIDDIKDRQIDLGLKLKTNLDIKIERSKRRQGLLLIYPLDSRAAGLDSENPIVGYSLHFPKIDNEEKVSYRTSIFNDYDQDLKEDDDNE